MLPCGLKLHIWSSDLSFLELVSVTSKYWLGFIAIVPTHCYQFGTWKNLVRVTQRLLLLLSKENTGKMVSCSWKVGFSNSAIPLEAFMSNVHSCCSTAWEFGIFIDQLSQIVLSQSMLQFMSLEFWEVSLGCDLDLLLQTCPTLLLWGPLWSLIHRCGDWMLVILHELCLEGSISTSGRCRL